jgi:hypothetical protein
MDGHWYQVTPTLEVRTTQRPSNQPRGKAEQRSSVRQGAMARVASVLLIVLLVSVSIAVCGLAKPTIEHNFLEG